MAQQATFITPLNKILAGMLMCTLALTGAIISSRLGIIDSFLQPELASAIIASHQTHINIGSTFAIGFPGFLLLLIAITELSSISAGALGYMPICAIFAVLVTYSLAKRFFPSGYAALAASLIASIVVLKVFSLNLFSVWPHAFGFALFFLFIYVFLDFLNKRTIETLAALWIIFIGLQLFSYMAELYAIAFLFFANVLMIASRKEYRPYSFSLLLAFLATYLAFNQAIYATWVPKFSVYSDQLVTAFRDYLSSRITGRAHAAPWAYISPPSTPVFRLLNIGWYALLLLPLVLVAAYSIYMMIRSRSTSVFRIATSATAIVLLSMLLVWPVDAITYSLIGGIDVAFTRCYNLIGPLTAAVLLVYLLRKIPLSGIRRRTPSILGIYLVALLVISAMLLPVAMANGAQMPSPDRHINVDPSATWLFSSTLNPQVVSDLYTEGEYGIVGAKQGITYDYNFMTPAQYGSLVDPGNTTGNGGSPSLLTDHYVVINLESFDLRTAVAWYDFEPLQPHMGSINSNSNLIRIYDDGNALTLKGI